MGNVTIPKTPAMISSWYIVDETIFITMLKNTEKDYLSNNKSDVYTIYYSYTIVFMFYFRSVCFPFTVELK